MTQLEKRTSNFLGTDRALMNNQPLNINLDSNAITAVTSSTFFTWSYWINYSPIDFPSAWLMPGKIYRLRS
jgi:hypothetical protein